MDENSLIAAIIVFVIVVGFLVYYFYSKSSASSAAASAPAAAVKSSFDNSSGTHYMEMTYPDVMGYLRFPNSMGAPSYGMSHVILSQIAQITPVPYHPARPVVDHVAFTKHLAAINAQVLDAVAQQIAIRAKTLAEIQDKVKVKTAIANGQSITHMLAGKNAAETPNLVMNPNIVKAAAKGDPVAKATIDKVATVVSSIKNGTSGTGTLATLKHAGILAPVPASVTSEDTLSHKVPVDQLEEAQKVKSALLKGESLASANSTLPPLTISHKLAAKAKAGDTDANEKVDEIAAKAASVAAGESDPSVLSTHAAAGHLVPKSTSVTSADAKSATKAIESVSKKNISSFDPANDLAGSDSFL